MFFQGFGDGKEIKRGEVRTFSISHAVATKGYLLNIDSLWALNSRF